MLRPLFAPLLLASAVALASCGGSDAVTACEDLCEAEVEGNSCPDTAQDKCEQLCDPVYGDLSDDCDQLAVKMLTCMKGLKYDCPSGSDVAISLDQGCTEETSAFTDAGCFQQ